MGKRKQRYLAFIAIACLILFLWAKFMDKETSPLLFNAILYLMILVIGTNLGALIGEFLPTPKRLKNIDPAKQKQAKQAKQQKKK